MSAALQQRALGGDAPIFSLDAAGQPARMIALSLLLARVLDNIVRNAVQYNRVGGNVTITAEVEEPAGRGWTSAHTVLRVTDTGHGIPEADREKVFERFYRVDRSRNRRTGGAGLGLAIASEVVRFFGGSIRVAATTPEGTTLEVRLPGGHPSTTDHAGYVHPAAS